MEKMISMHSLVKCLNLSSSKAYELLNFDIERDEISFPLSPSVMDKESLHLLFKTDYSEFVLDESTRRAVAALIELCNSTTCDLQELVCILPVVYQNMRGKKRTLAVKCVPLERVMSSVLYLLEFDILPTKSADVLPFAYNINSKQYWSYNESSWVMKSTGSNSLTPNEIEYFFISASGRTIHEAAECLSMSESSVKKIRRSLIEKFQATNLSQALKNNELFAFFDVFKHLG